MKKGFTLVELLAVLAILSVVLVIAGTSYSSVNKKNKKNQCENLKQQIENHAIEYVDEQNYFHSVSGLESVCSGNVVCCGSKYKKIRDLSENEKGDILYKELTMEMKKVGFNEQCETVLVTPVVLVDFENVLNYGYYDLNENNELENPYDGSVIKNLKIEVRFNTGNNYMATFDLDCGE